MASQVPYSGAPSVAPQDAPIPNRQASAPPDAFGIGVGQSIQHLGAAQQGAGNELWNRAIALQQMNQQADAANAVADFTTKLGERYAQYRSLQGKAAVDGYSPYIDDVNNIREQVGSGLSSDYARKVYLQESRSIQARSVFSAAAHSADQFKHYQIGSTQASAENSGRLVSMHPDDDALFQAKLSQNQSVVEQLSTIQGGWTDEQKANYKAKLDSTLVMDRAKSLANSDPFAADKFLTSAIKKGQISAGDAGQLSNYIRNIKNNIGTRNETAKLFGGDIGSIGNQIIPIAAAREAIAANESSGNYNPAHPEVTHKVNGQVITERALGRYGVMQSNLQAWLKEAGMPAMTEAAFLNDHAAQDKLFDFKFGQYMQEGGSANAAANKWFTGSYNPPASANDGHTSAPAYLQKFRSGLAKSMNLKGLVSAAEAHADDIAPGDLGFKQDYVNRVQTQFSHNNFQARQDQIAQSQIILDAMQPDASGKLPTSIDSITDPAVHDIYNNNTKLRASMNKQFAANAVGGYAPTEANQAQYHYLRGMFLDPLAPADARAEAMQTNIESLEMPWKDRKELLGLQTKAWKQADHNPALGQAMHTLMPMLAEAGITPQKSKTRFYQFQSTLFDVLQQKQATGKPYNPDEIKQVGAALLRDVSKPGALFGSAWPTQYKAFEMPVPEDERKKIIAAYKANNNGVEPTKQIIQDFYNVKMFNEFYASRPKADLNKPTVPIR